MTEPRPLPPSHAPARAGPVPKRGAPADRPPRALRSPVLEAISRSACRIVAACVSLGGTGTQAPIDRRCRRAALGGSSFEAHPRDALTAAPSIGDRPGAGPASGRSVRQVVGSSRSIRHHRRAGRRRTSSSSVSASAWRHPSTWSRTSATSSTPRIFEPWGPTTARRSAPPTPKAAAVTAVSRIRSASNCPWSSSRVEALYSFSVAAATLA